MPLFTRKESALLQQIPDFPLTAWAYAREEMGLAMVSDFSGNKPQALEHLINAAVVFPQAALAVGCRYETGNGMEPDARMAAFYYKVAAILAQGHVKLITGDTDGLAPRGLKKLTARLENVRDLAKTNLKRLAPQDKASLGG